MNGGKIMWRTKDNIEIKRMLTTNQPVFVSKKEKGIMIDTGRIKARRIILEKLDGILVNRELELIVLTHTHHDHIENIEQILEKYNVKVLVHRSETQHLSKLVKSENLIEFETKYDLKAHGINGYILHTPGHSDGSSSIILNDEIAIVGDLMGDFYTKPWAKNRKIVSNESLKSLECLIELRCSTYIPSYKKRVLSFDELKDFHMRYVNGEIIQD